MGTSINDPDVRARLESIINRRQPNTPPFGGFWSSLTSIFRAPTSVVASMRPALKTPDPVSRAKLKAHLFALKGRPTVIKPTHPGARPPNPLLRRPPAQRPSARPTSRPEAPPAPMPTPSQAASMPVMEPPAREVDVTPEPPYDGFHGFAPGFNEAGNDFGDLEADLGLD